MNDQTIVWIAGTGWDAVPGTDKRLVEAISKDHHVTWIDPPVPVRHVKELGELAAAGRHPEMVSRNVLRVRVPALPGVTRPGIRGITHVLLGRAIRQALSAAGRPAGAVVVAFPFARFPRWTDGQKILYVTDDWLGGSSLMGFSRRHIQRILVKNMGEAQCVAAVSEHLSDRLKELNRTQKDTVPALNFTVLPNGCLVRENPDLLFDRQPVAGLVGQLNERLDLDVLEAVQAEGVNITVIGPRAERNPEFRRRLDRFLAAENVQWLGHVAPQDLPSHLVHMGVGLTPYTDTNFNRASFPLKTLEYLSAGVPVVSTDIPAAHWLNTEHVKISESPEAFARNVVTVLSEPEDHGKRQVRRDFAANHSWAIRARQFQDLLAAKRESHLLNQRQPGQ